jgi:hypothetical protein
MRRRSYTPSFGVEINLYQIFKENQNLILKPGTISIANRLIAI